jgi:beta-lactamase regulating signal transducer with metallopeptidase domain
MNHAFESLSGPLVKAFGWMLLHSLWQGMLIATFTGILLIFLRKSSARARYWVANAGLWVLLIAAGLTFWLSIPDSVQAPASAQNLPAPEKAGAMPIDSLQTAPDPVPSASSADFFAFGAYFEQHLPLVFLTWFLGMGLLLLRLLGNIGYIHYIKTRHNFPADPYWLEVLDKLQQRSGYLKSIELIESALVNTPMTVGLLKPLILFPIGMINRLDPGAVEAILAHELGHIIRRDYLFNLIQNLIECLFYYHPAVWWLSAQIRREREIAADDFALQLTQNPTGYARALVAVQELSYGVYAPALAFASGKTQFFKRIQHILNIQSTKNLAMEKLIGTGAMLLLVFGLAYAQYSGKQHFSEDLEYRGDPTSGIWEGEIKDDKLCLTLSARGGNWQWTHGDCIPLSAFSALPQGEGEFTLSRDAGTITFKGKFENKEGYGRFRFAHNPEFLSWLKQQDITGLSEKNMINLFIGNCDKAFVTGLKTEGLTPISGEDLESFCIHGLNLPTLKAYAKTLAKMGTQRPSPEHFVTMKIHDISPEYIEGMEKTGLKGIDYDGIVSAKIHDVSPEYIEECRKMGVKNMNIEDILNYKIHGVDNEYINSLKAAGISDLSSEDVLNMKIHGLDPKKIEGFRKLGFTNLSPEELLNLSIHGIDGQFMDEMRSAGIEPLDEENIVNLKIHEISPDFVAQLRKAGINVKEVEDVINLKIHDISPVFIEQMKQGGFETADVEELVNLKIHEVNPKHIEAFKKMGFKAISIEDAINLKIHAVTPEFIQSMRDKGFKDLDLEEYIDLKIRYGSRME